MSIERQFKARTRTASVSTVIGITLVLVMLGFQGFVLLNASAVERYFKENVRVELFLKRDLKEVDVMRFRKELDTEAFTRETRYVTADEAAEQLKQDLRLSELPKHIECFDNSNTQGTDPVSACVVFKDAKPSKKDYRHFNIRTVEGPDDFASMEEAVERRYARS